jgi:hypothetical protein
VNVPLPADRREVDRFVEDEPATAGERLGALLFRRDVRQRFLEGRRWALSAAPDDDHRLVVRLRTDQRSVWLHALPWEEMPAPGSRHPLGLTSGIVLVRDVLRESAGRRGHAPGATPRLLVVVGAPEIDRPLDVAAEVDALDRLEKRGWKVDVAESGRLDEIRACCARAHGDGAPYDVLHFIGHGRLGQGEGKIKLRTGEDDRDAWVAGSFLAQQMADHPSPPLVVLNACDTAGSSIESPLAPALAFLENGVSSVLAMARPIPDRAAVAFADAFYSELADTRDPARALYAARLKLQAAHPEGPTWAIPVALGAWRPWGRSEPTPSRGGWWTAAGALLVGLALVTSPWSPADDPPALTSSLAATRFADRQVEDNTLDEAHSWSFGLVGCGRSSAPPTEVFCVVRVENLRDEDRNFTVYLDDSRLKTSEGAIHPATVLRSPDGGVTRGEGRAPILLAPASPATLVLAMDGVPPTTTTADLEVKYHGASVEFPAVLLESLSSTP